MSSPDAPCVNTTGKAMFVRDEHGELHVIKPGEPVPVFAQPAASSKGPPDAGEREGFFSEAPQRTAAAARQKAERGPVRGEGSTLLSAARAGDDDAVRAACQADENAVNLKDHLERTALHMAAYAGHSSTIELLLAFDARHSALACDATTPLHFAAQNGHTDACKMLLKAGAKVNVRGTKRNDTPLHLSAFRGHLECAQYLLKKNADVRLKNRAQRSPVDVASTEEMRELLTAAAQKKRSKDDSHTGPSACAEEDDDAEQVPEAHKDKQPRLQ